MDIQPNSEGYAVEPPPKSEQSFLPSAEFAVQKLHTFLTNLYNSEIPQPVVQRLEHLRKPDTWDYAYQSSEDFKRALVFNKEDAVETGYYGYQTRKTRFAGDNNDVGLHVHEGMHCISHGNFSDSNPHAVPQIGVIRNSEAATPADRWLEEGLNVIAGVAAEEGINFKDGMSAFNRLERALEQRKKTFVPAYGRTITRLFKFLRSGVSRTPTMSGIDTNWGQYCGQLTEELLRAKVEGDPDKFDRAFETVGLVRKGRNLTAELRSLGETDRDLIRSTTTFYRGCQRPDLIRTKECTHAVDTFLKVLEGGTKNDVVRFYYRNEFPQALQVTALGEPGKEGPVGLEVAVDEMRVLRDAMTTREAAVLMVWHGTKIMEARQGVFMDDRKFVQHKTIDSLLQSAYAGEYRTEEGKRKIIGRFFVLLGLATPEEIAQLEARKTDKMQMQQVSSQPTQPATNAAD